MSKFDERLDEILAKTIYDTGAKLTEIGWERWGENLEEAKRAIRTLVLEEVIGVDIDMNARANLYASKKGIEGLAQF